MHARACTHTHTTLKERCHSVCLTSMQKDLGSSSKTKWLLGKRGWAETAEDCMLGTRQRGGHSVRCCGITMMPSPPATIRSCLENIKKQKQNDTILLLFPAVVYYGRVQRAEWCSTVLGTSMLKFHCSLPICYFNYRALFYLVLQGCSTLSVILIFFLSFHIPV